MGSLPRAKAGVGSAMNDTTRQMGGALGVAVLGSVFATVYRPGDERPTAGLGLTAEQLSRAQGFDRRSDAGGATELPAARRPARRRRQARVRRRHALRCSWSRSWSADRRRRGLQVPAGPGPRRPRGDRPRPTTTSSTALASRQLRRVEGCSSRRRPRIALREADDRSACRCRREVRHRRGRGERMTAVAAAEPVVEAVQPAECEVVRPRPGRQRSEAADQAILGATLDLLALDGYGGMTMAAVIARSGVSSATLYRRWPTKQELVVAALGLAARRDRRRRHRVAGGRPARPRPQHRRAVSVRRDDVAESVLVELRRNPEFSAVDEKFLLPRLAVIDRGHRAGPRAERAGPGPARRRRPELRLRTPPPPRVRAPRRRRRGVPTHRATRCRRRPAGAGDGHADSLSGLSRRPTVSWRRRPRPPSSAPPPAPRHDRGGSGCVPGTTRHASRSPGTGPCPR